MATFNIGQFRRTQATNYTTPVTYKVGKKLQETDIIDFYDPELELDESDTISSLQSYYLAFSVKQLPNSQQRFTIKLEHSEMIQEDVQSVRTFIVPQGEGETYFELIFNPNAIYNRVVFELRRDALDFTMYNEDKTNGRFMQITVERFDSVTNIIDSYLKSKYSIKNGLRKIGIQGPPGLLFVLNGEEMHIGRTGIYELYYDDITIKTIGFILKESLVTQDGLDYFTMDFKYY